MAGIDALRTPLWPVPGVEDLVTDVELPAAEFSSAPLLDAWAIWPGPKPRLCGHVVGHPDEPDGPIVTSVLKAIARNQMWARSTNRIYRLGRRAEERGH
jgi:uncharacterized protein DUF6634